MSRARSVIAGLFTITLFVSTGGHLAASDPANDTVPPLMPESRSSWPAPQAATVPTVALLAASGATIPFTTQNGETVDDVPPRTLDLPYLVLYRNHSLTDPVERTLIAEVTGIQGPPEGVTVTLEISTQHGNPDGHSGEGISVWRDSQRIAGSTVSTPISATVVFTHEFNPTALSGGEMIKTPTDYFRYDITVVDSGHSTADPWHAIGEDHAFLMENQEVVRIPEVREGSEGAAPDELVVYYCDMFPFQKSDDDISTRVLRRDIPDFVLTQLVPQMIEAFHVEADVWGFPWYHEWNSYRLGEEPGRLSVALTEGQIWFHGRAPSNGHAGISINVNGGDHAPYDSLDDGVMSTFYHELFHNLQAGINRTSGGDGDVDGEENAWQFFSEGTAVLASSVGQPAVHFAQTDGLRYPMFQANQFLLSNVKSYEQMSSYRGVIYWRFLYEQCGGMQDGVEDPAAGMRIISRALTALYSRDIVDISSSADLVENLPRVMDHALADASCPFQTYEDSLVHFSRAIYALRLDGGRCTGPGTPAGCGFYDPNSLYVDPPLNTVTYTGTRQRQSGLISSNFDMDFVDVSLHPATDGQPLTLELYGVAGSNAEFRVELWELIDAGLGTKPWPISAQATAPQTMTTGTENGHLSYTIPAIDTDECNRLGLIITRVDANQSWNPKHVVVLNPVESE